MHPRFKSPLSVFRNSYRRADRSVRLALGAAAAATVAAAGIAAAVSGGTAPAAPLSAINHAADARAAGHADARVGTSKPALSSHMATHMAPAHRADHTRQHATRQRPAKPQHQAPARAQHPTTVHGAAHDPSRRAARAAARHAAARSARPYLIYDSVTPSAIPGHHVIATYATGNYAVSPAQVAGRAHVMWIDTTGTDPHASILDVEPGDATPSMAAVWARQRLAADPHALARIYTMQSEWPATQAAIATLPAQMRSRVRWWIADPTGYPHIVPGSDATQWYWGSSYDITTATPRF